LEAAVVAAEAAHAANPTVDTQYALSQAQNRLLQANRMISPPTGGGAFDWTHSQFARTGAGFIAGQSAVGQFTGWMGIGTQETIQGGYNLQARSRQTGEAIGIAIGVGIGALTMNPAVGLIAATFGQQIIGSLAEWSTAPAQAKLNAFSALAPSAKVIGEPGMEALSGMRKWIHRGSGWSPLHDPSEATLGGAWSALSGGMMQGGIWPNQPMPGLERGPAPYPDAMSDIDSAYSLAKNPTGPFPLIRVLSGAVMGLIKQHANINAAKSARPETLSMRLTRILAAQYGSDTMGEIAKEQSGILGASAETGQNPADILSRFGVMPTARYYKMIGGLSARTEAGMSNAEPGISAEQLFLASRGAQEGGRAARLGAYQMRGSGAAVFGGLGRQMEAYASLPGGADSEAYAKAASQQRDAQMAMYAQQDIMAYAIPQTRIGAQRGVLNALPYAPGFRFGLELQSIALNRQQMGVVKKRLAAGNLTEEQQLKLEEQLAGLQVSTATSVSALTEGLENRLPALAAGRPSRFSRMDSTQLAALNVGRMGHPARSFGAINGRQLAEQNAFVDALLGPGGANMVAPMSKDLPVGSNRIEALLERIAQILQQNGGAGQGPRTRVGEAVNKGQAVATGNPAPNYGNGNYN